MIAMYSCSETDTTKEEVPGGTATEAGTGTTTEIVQSEDVVFDENSKLSTKQLQKFRLKEINPEDAANSDLFSLKGNINLETVKDAKLLLFDAKGEFVAQTNINDDGSVSLKDIQKGHYFAVLSKPMSKSTSDLAIVTDENQVIFKSGSVNESNDYNVGSYMTDSDIQSRSVAKVRKDSLISRKSSVIKGKVSTAGNKEVTLLLVNKSGKIVGNTKASPNNPYEFNNLNPDDYNVVLHPTSGIATSKLQYADNTSTQPNNFKIFVEGETITQKQLTDNTVTLIAADKIVGGNIHGKLVHKSELNSAKNETVWLANEKGHILKKSQTSSDGSIDFKQLKPHNYYILAINGQKEFKFDLSSGEGKGDLSAKALYEKAVKKLAENDVNGATQLLDKAVAAQPSYYDAYMTKGEIMESNTQINDALTNYSLALEAKPNDINALYKQAVMKINLEQYSSAASDLNRVIEMDPKFTQAYFHRGVANNHLNLHNQAVRDYLKMLSLDPNAGDCYFNLGSSYLNLRQYDNAIDAYNKAVIHNANDSEIYTHRGMCYKFKGKNKEALADFNRSIAINDNYDAYLHKAEILENEKEYKDLEDLYNHAIATHQNVPQIYYHRAIFFNNRKKYDEALADFNKAISMNAKIGYFYSDRAITYSEKKMNKEACGDLAKAKELGQKTDLKLSAKVCK